MTVIVDRIEGGFLVVEMPDGSMQNLPKLFSPDAKEGDMIEIFVDHEKTENRRQEIKGRMESLFKD